MKAIQVITLVLCVVIAGLLAYQLFAPRSGGAGAANVESLREEATLLRSSGLDDQAAERYEQYLRQASLPAVEEANLRFVLGTLYQDNLLDYGKALAQYTIIHEKLPNTEAAEKVGKRMVECQEALGKSRDAQRTLAQVTDLDAASVEGATAGVVVGKIGDRDVTMGQVEKMLELLPEQVREQVEKDPEQLKNFTREFIVRELLYARALRNGYEKDEKYKQQLAAFQRQLLAERVREEELKKRVSFTEGDLKRYYDGNPLQFVTPTAVELAQIVVKTASDAEVALAQIQAGSDFAAVARQHSLDTATRDKGGDLGKVTQGQPLPGIGSDPVIAKAVFAAQVQSVTGPFETDAGQRLFLVKSKTEAVRQTMDQARSQVEAGLRQEKEREAFEELVQEMLKVENATIYEERIKG